MLSYVELQRPMPELHHGGPKRGAGDRTHSESVDLAERAIDDGGGRNIGLQSEGNQQSNFLIRRRTLFSRFASIRRTPAVPASRFTINSMLFSRPSPTRPGLFLAWQRARARAPHSDTTSVLPPRIPYQIGHKQRSAISCKRCALNFKNQRPASPPGAFFCPGKIHAEGRPTRSIFSLQLESGCPPRILQRYTSPPDAWFVLADLAA